MSSHENFYTMTSESAAFFAFLSTTPNYRILIISPPNIIVNKIVGFYNLSIVISRNFPIFVVVFDAFCFKMLLLTTSQGNAIIFSERLKE